MGRKGGIHPAEPRLGKRLITPKRSAPAAVVKRRSRDGTTANLKGLAFRRDYTYYTPELAEVGGMVDIGTRNDQARGMATRIDVPEAGNAAFKDKAKSIIGKAALRCEDCEFFNPIGEGDHICDEDPTKMSVSDYAPTEDCYWCQEGKNPPLSACQ